MDSMDAAVDVVRSMGEEENRVSSAYTVKA
jgi:hypothetical protein